MSLAVLLFHKHLVCLRPVGLARVSMHAQIVYKAALIMKLPKGYYIFITKSFFISLQRKYEVPGILTVCCHTSVLKKEKEVNFHRFSSDHSAFFSLCFPAPSLQAHPSPVELPANEELRPEGTAAAASLLTPLGFH